ncbi:CoA-disulfide reductase [Bacillus sp. ZZV12-4809]|nr:CoA-disulfide reductase [Bacillus sp. ZZV12-4809]SUV05041.1 SirA family protein [Cytobacillus firmus]
MPTLLRQPADLALNYEWQSFVRNKLGEIPKDQTVYVSCQVGLRGYLASRILKNNVYKVKNVDGGWKTYSSVYGTNISKNTETKKMTLV